MRFADPAKARETLAPLTEAQVKDMPDDTYWSDLVFRVDEEIQRLEALAQPDDEELAARSRIEADPKNLEGYNDLANILIAKNRLEEAIPVLLDILTIERNWSKAGEKKP
jgi:thioredoxin-like negative regulator of GroEL